MRHFFTKSILVWLWIIFTSSCQVKPNEPIDFGVSEGVMNNMKFSPLNQKKGKKLQEVSLHNLQKKSFKLNSLKNDHPMLLITGSYTCDVTRNNLVAIDKLYEKYKDVVDIFLINTLEAHPLSSQSPYSAEPSPWLTQDNIEAGISAEQPQDMEERHLLAEKWISEQDIRTPVLLDGPNNEFWNQAGQAPNMSFLFSAEGELVLNQPWFELEELEEAIRGEF